MIVSNHIRKMLRFCAIVLIFVLAANLKMVYGQQPNVILIIADDYRHDWMRHKGKSFMHTPWLDKLSKDGWSFPNAFCGAGVCSPGRASILTGKPMHQASAPDITWQNNSFLQLQTMFPQRLHEAGYKTAYIGKFHLGNEEHWQKGYDLWASFPFVGRYFNQPLWINGKRVPTAGFTDDVLSAMAADTLQAWSRTNQPFCMVVGLKAPHIPFTPPPRMDSSLTDQFFEEPATFRLDYSQSKPGLKNNLINARNWPAAIPQFGNFQNWVRQYSRLATTLDESLGKIMATLEKTPAAHNTIVIFTSDHGYSLGEFNLCEKHYAYEQVMRVPMLVKFPNHVRPGQAPDDLIAHEDIAATIYDYCLGEVPDDVTGKSWRPLQQKQKYPEPFRDAVFFDFWHANREQLPPMQAVRTSRYKYIEYEYKPYKELYDLVNDPLEIDNLAGKRKFSGVEKSMKSKLDRWKRNTQWNTRTQVSIKSAIVMDSVSWNNKVDGQTGKKSFGPYDLEISFLQKAERAGTAINIQRFKPANGGAKPVFVAIPVENLANFDPFIYISISFPGDTTKYAAPVVGMYDGREIYYNIHAKKQRKIPVTSPQETQLRKGFDGSYNSPVPPGKSCIILKVYLTANAPENMSITASGALKHLRWL